MPKSPNHAGQRKAQDLVTTAAQATSEALLAMTRALQAPSRRTFEQQVEQAKAQLAAAQADLERALLQPPAGLS